MEQRSSAIKVLVASLLIALAVILIIFLQGCSDSADRERLLKDRVSEQQGGLYRNMEIYDINGTLIREIKGKYDIEPSKGMAKLKFENDGLRYIVYCAPAGFVIVEELEE